jgi:hypothetical protein
MLVVYVLFVWTFYWVCVLELCFCWVHVLHVRFSWIHALCLSCVFVLLLCIVHILPSHYYCPSFTMCPYFSFGPLLCLSSMLHPWFFFMLLLCLFFYNTSILFICVNSHSWCLSFTLSLQFVFYMCADVAFVLVFHTNVMPFLCVVAFVFFLHIVIVPFLQYYFVCAFPLHYCYAFPLHFFERYVLLCTIVMFHVLPSHCCNVYVFLCS